MKSALERDVRLVRFEDGTLELALEPSARKTLVQELSKKLADWTGRRWMVAVSAEAGQPSLRAQADARKAELKDVVREDPLVQAVLQRFPGAEIVDVRPPAGDAAASGEEIESPDGERRLVAARHKAYVCRDAVQRETVHRRSGIVAGSASITIPGLQRTTACCAAPGITRIYRCLIFSA